MFGRGNNQEPNGVRLSGKGQDAQEIKLSKLTEEILKEDIGFIRMFYQRLTEVLNEKLSLLDGVINNQQQLDALLNKFGSSQDQLVNANLGVLEELKKFAAHQDSNNARIIKTLLDVIESLNQVVESQKQIIAKFGNSSVEFTEIELEKIRLTEPAVVSETSPASDVLETQAGVGGNRDGEFDENSFSENLSEKPESDAGERQTDLPIDPQMFAAQLLEGIRNNILTVFGGETEIQARNADDIPGIQCNDIWLVALPPKSDGKYDSSVMQDTAFKKIKTLLSKNSKETVIAVYKGDISEKKLTGAKRVADDYKIILTNFTDINKVLARATTVESAAG